MGIELEMTPATPSEGAQLLDLIRTELAARIDMLMRAMGLTWDEFAALYQSRGEARTLKRDGAVVGFCWIEHRASELHLHAIFVLPQYRRQGIGSAVLESLEAEFCDRVEVIELGVEEDNPAARRLYERHGFEVEQVLPEVSFAVMRKHLG